MENLEGKVAVITGAGSGIGKGMAQAFAAAGSRLVLADIEEQNLHDTVVDLADTGADVTSVPVDVSSAESVDALAETAYAAYGGVHVVCNNAGVAENNLPAWELSLDDWDWVLGINLMGVVHGVRSFVPRMLEDGAPGHIVNTASIGGLVAGLALPAYTTSKHAVVGFTECLYNDLARSNAAVTASVLCPGWVNTGIADSDRNRPDRPPLTDELRRSRNAFNKSISSGLDPRQVGDIVVQGIEAERFYLYTHPEWNDAVVDRFEAIMDGKKPASTYLPRS